MAKYESYQKSVLEASVWLSEEGFFGSHKGTGGNVSVRADEAALAITPSSVKYQEIKVSDICVVGFDLSVIEGNDKLKPSVETGMHSIIYKKRPDVNAIVHTHQIYGSIFALINTPIPALFDEVSFSLGAMIEVIPYALSGSPELVNNVAGKLSNNANAYIIQNHGILALGKTLDKAILHTELLEKVANIYCLALSTGKQVSTLPAEIVELARTMRDYEVKAAREK
ncbi:MAG: class II aldolase/adducin family protein [Smithella sp.]|jgi:ribulose-5-phosphate 4-epimerase/fuculose-1-phosphate aldolase